MFGWVAVRFTFGKSLTFQRTSANDIEESLVRMLQFRNASESKRSLNEV